jgi:hypothetical protein
MAETTTLTLSQSIKAGVKFEVMGIGANVETTVGYSASSSFSQSFSTSRTVTRTITSTASCNAPEGYVTMILF